MITKIGPKKWRLWSTHKKKGKRRNLGTFSSEVAAKRHENQISFFKHAAKVGIKLRNKR